MEYGRPHQVLGDFFRITYVENPGMAFGIQIGSQLLFTIFAFMATIVILIYIFKAKAEKFALRLSLALVLGGAVGNLIDRLLYGKVVDFLEFSVGRYRWPIFNFADAAVTTGMVVLIALILFDKNLKKDDEKISTEEEVFS
jgi:signal peptidase II